jgi:hypothetical protein
LKTTDFFKDLLLGRCLLFSKVSVLLRNPQVDFWSLEPTPVTIMADKHWCNGNHLRGLIPRILRALQFIFAIIVAALYGVDLSNATHNHAHANSSWVYAEFVACLSLLTCLIHCFWTVIKVAWTIWDWVLFVLWAAQTGVFGTMFISGSPIDDDEFTLSVQRMKIAVWVDVINMLLWCATAVHGIAWCISERRMTTLAKTRGVEGGNEEPISGLAAKRQNDPEAVVKKVETFKRPTAKPKSMVEIFGSSFDKGSNDTPPKYSP